MEKRKFDMICSFLTNNNVKIKEKIGQKITLEDGTKLVSYDGDENIYAIVSKEKLTPEYQEFLNSIWELDC